MAPDRPDASEVEAGAPLVRRVFGFCEAYNITEGDNASGHQEHYVEETSLTADEVVIEEEELEDDEEEEEDDEVVVPPMVKPEPCDDKSSSHSDDDLTSLSWLHQQNLLKGLEITSQPVKATKDENALNINVICEDSLDISENTNSVSSLDDSYSPGNPSSSPAQMATRFSLFASHTFN
jgi:forkhead box protein N